ncbi:MAG: glycosyltransferase [Rhodocyclaceae bacterium]|nr:glycosyltransferase [Rhodocyclaceae bacterium]
MRCDIVMATWNAVAMTRTALESLKREAHFSYRLILVDNSEDEEARAYFRDIAASHEFGETLLIQNEKNIGWLKATNIGLRHVEAEYVCLLNNDVICGSAWLARCIALMQREPDIGLVNPRGNERSENRQVGDVNAYAHQLIAGQNALYTELAHCSGFCMVVQSRIFQELGLLDEIFDGGYYEDNDFSYRARAAGFRAAQCDDAFVLHLGSQSFKKLPSDVKRQMIARNRQICEARWGVPCRQLLLVEKRDIEAGVLIDLIRKERVYLVDNQHIPQQVRHFRHAHLTLLAPGWLGARGRFLLSWLYLAGKSRIDQARVLIA